MKFQFPKDAACTESAAIGSQNPPAPLMDILLGLLFIGAAFVLVIVLPIAAISVARRSERHVEDLRAGMSEERKRAQEREAALMRRLQQLEGRLAGGAEAPVVAAAVAEEPPVSAKATSAPPPPVTSPEKEPPPLAAAVSGSTLPKVEEKQEPVKSALPETQAPAAAVPAPMALAATSVPSAAVPPLPPPLPGGSRQVVKHPVSSRETSPPVAPPSPPAKAPATLSSSALEQFMGVKLFAWVGGLALFLGIVFFIKLSMERGWISEQTRITIGYITGLALVAGGWFIDSRKAYAVLGQTLCATGIVALYGVTFAAHAYYDFPAFTPELSFGLMSVITIGAFLLAVRMDAQVVAVLGMLGGFLTPILCSTGQDRPLALFGYITLLDVGVLAVAWRKQWLHLTPLAAFGTFCMQYGWAISFFSTGGYAHGARIWTPVTVFFGFAALFTLAAWWQSRRKDRAAGVAGLHPAFSALFLCGSALLAAFCFIVYPHATDRVGLTFAFALAVNLLVLAVAWKDARLEPAPLFAAAGTICLQLAWSTRYFISEGYAVGGKTWIAFAVFLGFALFYTLVMWGRKRLHLPNPQSPDIYDTASALVMCASAMVAAFAFLGFSSLTGRPATLYTYTLLVNVLVMAITWLQPRAALASVLIAGATFIHLLVWTVGRLAPEHLPAALVVYLIFGGLYTVFAILWQRHHPMPMQFAPGWVPVVTLPLMLLPVLNFDSVSMLVWPSILVVDLLIIGLALISRALPTVFASLALTMITVMCWLFKMPNGDITGLPAFLGVLGGFAVVFSAAGCVLARRILQLGGEEKTVERDMARFLPVCAAGMPFILLIMALAHLRVPDPTMVFGMALLFSIFLLALGRIMRITALPLAAVIGVTLLEFTWHGRNFTPENPVMPLLWYLGFHALFTLHPHLFRKKLEDTVYPWAAAALAGVGTFVLVHDLVKHTWPNDYMGLIPAAFAVPQLLSLAAVQKLHRGENPARLAQLAWFGGVALLFITLIFPIQFDRQWLTVSWALEGAALCWLFRKVPHPGLRGTGTVLLIIAFIRLALNPAVLTYQVRGEMAILNWQLYAYSVAAISLFLAAWWLNPPRHLLQGINLRALFGALGGILLFLLVNIEIADAFTEQGRPYIVFEFSGNFARDMTYSIAWGLFALGLLVAGFALRNAPTRYTGIALLAITLLKLFFHDLARIGSIYRIGALIALALIALAASFLYQRFLNKEKREPEEG